MMESLNKVVIPQFSPASYLKELNAAFLAGDEGGEKDREGKSRQ